jgi:class 3 adenylate cyclase
MWNAVVADGSMAVVICGEAGIGKTTLVEAFVEQWAGESFLWRAACSTHDFFPAAPIHALLSEAGVETMEDLLGDERAPLDDSGRPGFRLTRALAQSARLLIERAGSAPTIVLLDDLHWGGEPVRNFVRILIDDLERAKARHRLFFVTMTRLPPPSHPLSAALADLERRSRVRRLDVGYLDTDSIERIVDDEVVGRPSETFIGLVSRSARGNPLRARAAVNVLRQRGVPSDVRASDSRTWSALRVPLPLDDPVAAWIDDVRRAGGRALDVAAVYGSEFALADLAGLAEVDRSSAAECLQGALDMGLLASDGISYWFAHPQFRELLYDRLGPLERPQAHLQCMSFLEQSPSSPAADVAIGHHCVGAGDLVPVARRVRALEQAGRASIRLTMWPDAARYLEAAAQVATLADAPPAADDLENLLGQAYYFAHDSAAAIVHLERAVASAAQRRDDEVWATSLATLIRLVISTDTEAWTKVVDDGPVRAFLAVADDPRHRSIVLQVLAEAQIVAGQHDDAERSASEAAELARVAGDPTVLAEAVYAQAFNDMGTMQLTRGLDRTLSAVRHAMEGDDWYVQDVMKARLPFPMLESGRLVDADRAAADSAAAAAANHEYSNQALGYCVQAACALMRGDFASVDQFGEVAAAAVKRSGYVMADLFIGPTLVVSHMYRGDFERARSLAADWPNLPGAARAALLGLIDGFAIGRDGPTREPLRAPRSINPITIGFHAARIEAALLSGDVGALSESSDNLARWCGHGFEISPGYPTSLLRVRGEIVLARGTARDALALLDRAAGHCRRSGAHAELARTLAAQARAHSRLNEPSVAVELTESALRLADDIGMARVILHVDDILVAEAISALTAPADEAVVMFTDVVGSTVVSRDLGDVAYLDLVLRHHDIVRGVLRRWAGNEFNDSGDGLLAWFSDVGHALLAAVEIQEAIQSTTAVQPRLEVKVALALGRPLFHEGRPYGLVVNRAARVLGCASAGEVLIDEHVRAALPGAYEVASAQEVDLRGIGLHLVSTVRLGGDRPFVENEGVAIA